MTLRHSISENHASLTVYSPDATQSQLLGHLDHMIHEQAGLVPIFRQWIHHDVASITRFYGGEVTEETASKTIDDYENIPLENIQYGHYVVRLFITGASLLTIWQGDNAIENLLAVKGTTHPAESPQNTIRGGLWCDNSVCNLLHCSDEPDEVLREIDALRLNDLLDKSPTQQSLIPKQALSPNYVAHSSIVIALHAINRWLFTHASTQALDIQLPKSGDAKDTMQSLSVSLREIVSNYPKTIISDFADAYFEGDIVSITPLLHQLPLTTWEQFVIQCGTLTRHQWDYIS